MPLLSLPRTTKAASVREAILREILAGTFGPGDRLVEAALAAELGVSQATVNVALHELHAQGIVQKSLNRETKVSRLGRDQLKMLFVVRALLEPEVARLAAQHATSQAVELLREYLEEMREAVELHKLSKFYLADYHFHQQMYRMVENPFLEQACRAIAIAPFAYLFCDVPGPVPGDYRRIAEEHREVIDALLVGSEAAVEVTQRNMNNWRDFQMDFLSSIE